MSNRNILQHLKQLPKMDRRHFGERNLILRVIIESLLHMQGTCHHVLDTLENKWKKKTQHMNMCVYQLAVTLLYVTKDWGLSWSINMASSDCSQQPQGQHCLINFTTEADGCGFKFSLQRVSEALCTSQAQTAGRRQRR